MKYSLEAQVVSSARAGEKWTRLEIRAPEIAAAAAPGQFVQVKAWEGAAPLLRRPFSIAGADGSEKILLLIKKVGPGTRIICGLAPGDRVQVAGPLGNTFVPTEKGGEIYLVAGGVGVAPLRFFIERFPASGVTLFYGSRDSSEMAILDDIALKNVEMVISTEDGSAGAKGLVTEQLEKAVLKKKPSLILTCGPAPMMREVARIAVAAGVTCRVSMETYMGCGIGACMGCVVPVTAADGKPYLHACMDGPVMDASAVDWANLK